MLVVIGATAIAAFGECSGFAPVPLPAEAEQIAAPATAPNCASYRSYCGIGRPVDYAAARACAWEERLAQKADLGQNSSEPSAWVVGGSLILADIYFNGAGVKRNIPLAMRLACESEGFAVSDIGSRAADGPIEFCDYAATTLTANFCAAYMSQVGDERRGRYFNSLKSSMTAEQNAAFEKLLNAEGAYIEAHASEVDREGTIRVVRILKSQSILKDLFQTEVFDFEHRRWAAVSAKEVGLAGTLLDREYEEKLRELSKHTEDETKYGAVTSGDLAHAEDSWQAYLDAWVVFARLRYPANVDIIGAEITLD